MVRARTFDSYMPRRGRDLAADRTKVVEVELGSITATDEFIAFRSPGRTKITKFSLVASANVAGLNESYWTFQVLNASRGNITLFSTAPTTQPSSSGGLTANQNYDLPAVSLNEYLGDDDVLVFQATKTASAPNISDARLYIEYEIEEGDIEVTTTSTSTTTTTTTTTTTSTTTTITSTSTTITTTSSSTTSTTTTTTSTTTTTTTTSSSTTTTTTTTTTISTSTTTT